jgi:hypothetical protein
MREEKIWLRLCKWLLPFFLLSAKDISEPNTPNNKFHGI